MPSPNPPQPDEPHVRLAELIAALSLATDLGTAQPLEHAMRTCILAMRLSEALGLPQAERREIYYVALLRMIGCTADAHVVAAVLGDELAARAWLARAETGNPASVLGALIRHLGEGNPPVLRARMVATALAGLPRLVATGAAHCEVAQLLAGRLGFGAQIQTALGQVFERWDGRGVPNGLRHEQIARPVRVVQLTQDAVVAQRIGGVEAAIATARRRAGGAYDPQLVEPFCREAHQLFSEAGGSTWDTVLAIEPGAHAHLSSGQLDDALAAVADFVDLKSPVLSGHSRGVAELAAAAAKACRLPPTEVLAVRRAGLLHDVGRVGVTAAIWGKAAPLSDAEWERVRLHPYFTERVLQRPPALAPLAALAAAHHERIDGSGHHRSTTGAQLSFLARILCAADVYHALTEPRAHRAAFARDSAASVLQQEARVGRLDRESVDAVLAAAGHQVRPSRHAGPGGLSAREVEVLSLLARGSSIRDVASRLTVSPATANHHVRHIYTKLGVSTRAAATLFAMQHNLVELGDGRTIA